MPRLLCICLLLISSISLWSQVEPAASGGGFDLDDLHMMTPPPVSGDAYPVMVGSEMRSNYVSAGLVFTGAYMDNLLVANSAGHPMSDESYTFLPTFGLDRRTPRQGETLTYSSGFTLYHNTSQLNGVSQNAQAGYRFHLSPYAVIEVRDQFSQNYNLYNRGNPFVGGGVSGTPGSTNSVVVAPLENQLGNSSTGAIEYQYGRNAMIGGTVSYSFLKYSDSPQSLGLSNGNTTGVSAFYSRRIGRSEYVGAIYQFSKYVTEPVGTYTQTHTPYGFYTHYFTENFSLSILAGPEHYIFWNSTDPKRSSWTPAVQGSFGWQASRWSASAGYSHVVSGAGGLIGTFDSNIASLSAQTTFLRNWTVGANGEYSLFKNVHSAPTAPIFGFGGHTVTGTAFLRRTVSGRVNIEGGYAHFHQSYAQILAASSLPDSNRVYISVAYWFNRPLGR